MNCQYQKLSKIDNKFYKTGDIVGLNDSFFSEYPYYRELKGEAFIIVDRDTFMWKVSPLSGIWAEPRSISAQFFVQTLEKKDEI